MTASNVEYDIWNSEQRTELAWSRSGLSILTCVLILARRLTSLITSPRMQLLALALGIVIVGTAGVYALAWRGNRERHFAVRARLIGAGTMVLATIGLVLAMFPPN